MPIEALQNRRWGFDTNCFVCNPDNVRGLQVPFFHDTDGGYVFADFTLPADFSGAPTYVHGGATLALIDEGMSWATIALATKFAFTRQTTATFDWPIRIGRQYRLEVRVTEQDERRIITDAVVLDEKARPCVTAQADMAILSEAQAVDAIGSALQEDEAKFLQG